MNRTYQTYKTKEYAPKPVKSGFYRPRCNTFKCLPNNAYDTNSLISCDLQGIIFSNGTIKIGVDVWRDLDKHDISQYPFKLFNSMEELQKHYHLIPDKKGYFMDSDETKLRKGGTILCS